jgi:hypothetical protein
MQIKNRLLATLALLTLAAASACSGGGRQAFVPAAQPGDALQPLETPAQGYYPMRGANAARPICGRPAHPEQMRCFAWMRTDLVPDTIVENGVPKGVGYSPADVAAAYGLKQKRGANQTVATVDAYGYSQAESDLAFYRKAAGLPPCTTANGCLHIVNQHGAAAPLPQPNSNPNDDWRGEQALDLDAISASCPKCKIVLVQTNSDYSSDLAAGVTTAVTVMHANVVSNSYGGSESTAYAANYNYPGHLILAAAGDNGGGLLDGGGPQSPCTLATVVCVGGTHLVRASNARGWKESVWNDLASNACGGSCGGTGSGCSAIIPKPSWQTDAGCPHRSSVDVSAVASVYTPLAVYSVLFKQFPPYSAWAGYGGTSLSTPLLAGMFALAGNAATRHGAQEIWQAHAAFNDVLAGTNVVTSVSGPCASAVLYICKAGKGYDGPTGWGTPVGTTGL